jgi:hypothetical protein
MTPQKVQQKLFEVRDQIHLIHLNTTSYSEHKALNQFYEGWLDQVDKFIETFQGKYGRIGGTITIEVNSGTNARTYLVELMAYLNDDILNIFDPVVDSDLDNIIADMKQLINQTLYLLTLK